VSQRLAERDFREIDAGVGKGEQGDDEERHPIPDGVLHELLGRLHSLRHRLHVLGDDSHARIAERMVLYFRVLSPLVEGALKLRQQEIELIGGKNGPGGNGEGQKDTGDRRMDA